MIASKITPIFFNNTIVLTSPVRLDGRPLSKTIPPMVGRLSKTIPPMVGRLSKTIPPMVGRLANDQPGEVDGWSLITNKILYKEYYSYIYTPTST